MTVAILGTGSVGRTLIQALSHRVEHLQWGTADPALTLSRFVDEQTRQTVSSWLVSFPNVSLVAYGQCAADVYINASKGESSLAVLEAVGKQALEGKIVIDVANSLDFSRGFPPSLTVCNTDSLAETLQRRFPQAHVVKALNTMTASVMVNPESIASGDHHVFVCGNSADARTEVKTLLARWFGWKNHLDLGDLTAARGTEMVLPLWLKIMQATGSGHFQFKIAGLK